MKNWILLLISCLIGVVYFGIVEVEACSGAGCNGNDPSQTSCWNDASIAKSSSNGTLENRNMYSPSCVANYSYTHNTNYSYSYLSDETVGVYTYDSPIVRIYVWNSMYDGSGLVCTRRHRGTSPGGHNVSTSQSCS